MSNRSRQRDSDPFRDFNTDTPLVENFLAYWLNQRLQDDYEERRVKDIEGRMNYRERDQFRHQRIDIKNKQRGGPPIPEVVFDRLAEIHKKEVEKKLPWSQRNTATSLLEEPQPMPFDEQRISEDTSTDNLSRVDYQRILHFSSDVYSPEYERIADNLTPKDIDDLHKDYQFMSPIIAAIERARAQFSQLQTESNRMMPKLVQSGIRMVSLVANRDDTEMINEFLNHKLLFLGNGKALSKEDASYLARVVEPWRFLDPQFEKFNKLFCSVQGEVLMKRERQTEKLEYPRQRMEAIKQYTEELSKYAETEPLFPGMLVDAPERYSHRDFRSTQQKKRKSLRNRQTSSNSRSNRMDFDDDDDDNGDDDDDEEDDDDDDDDDEINDDGNESDKSGQYFRDDGGIVRWSRSQQRVLDAIVPPPARTLPFTRMNVARRGNEVKNFRGDSCRLFRGGHSRPDDDDAGEGGGTSRRGTTAGNRGSARGARNGGSGRGTGGSRSGNSNSSGNGGNSNNNRRGGGRDNSGGNNRRNNNQEDETLDTESSSSDSDMDDDQPGPSTRIAHNEGSSSHRKRPAPKLTNQPQGSKSTRGRTIKVAARNINKNKDSIALEESDPKSSSFISDQRDRAMNIVCSCHRRKSCPVLQDTSPIRSPPQKRRTKYAVGATDKREGSRSTAITPRRSKRLNSAVDETTPKQAKPSTKEVELQARLAAACRFLERLPDIDDRIIMLPENIIVEMERRRLAEIADEERNERRARRHRRSQEEHPASETDDEDSNQVNNYFDRLAQTPDDGDMPVQSESSFLSSLTTGRKTSTPVRSRVYTKLKDDETVDETLNSIRTSPNPTNIMDIDEDPGPSTSRAIIDSNHSKTTKSKLKGVFNMDICKGKLNAHPKTSPPVTRSQKRRLTTDFLNNIHPINKTLEDQESARQSTIGRSRPNSGNRPTANRDRTPPSTRTSCSPNRVAQHGSIESDNLGSFPVNMAEQSIPREIIQTLERRQREPSESSSDVPVVSSSSDNTTSLIRMPVPTATTMLPPRPTVISRQALRQYINNQPGREVECYQTPSGNVQLRVYPEIPNDDLSDSNDWQNSEECHELLREADIISARQGNGNVVPMAVERPVSSIQIVEREDSVQDEVLDDESRELAEADDSQDFSQSNSPRTMSPPDSPQEVAVDSSQEGSPGESLEIDPSLSNEEELSPILSPGFNIRRENSSADSSENIEQGGSASENSPDNMNQEDEAHQMDQENQHQQINQGDIHQDIVPEEPPRDMDRNDAPLDAENNAQNLLQMPIDYQYLHNLVGDLPLVPHLQGFQREHPLIPQQLPGFNLNQPLYPPEFQPFAINPPLIHPEVYGFAINPNVIAGEIQAFPLNPHALAQLQQFALNPAGYAVEFQPYALDTRLMPAHLRPFARNYPVYPFGFARFIPRVPQYAPPQEPLRPFDEQEEEAHLQSPNSNEQSREDETEIADDLRTHLSTDSTLGENSPVRSITEDDHLADDEGSSRDTPSDIEHKESNRSNSFSGSQIDRSPADAIPHEDIIPLVLVHHEEIVRSENQNLSDEDDQNIPVRSQSLSTHSGDEIVSTHNDQETPSPQVNESSSSTSSESELSIQLTDSEKSTGVSIIEKPQPISKNHYQDDTRDTNCLSQVNRDFNEKCAVTADNKTHSKKLESTESEKNKEVLSEETKKAIKSSQQLSDLVTEEIDRSPLQENQDLLSVQKNGVDHQYFSQSSISSPKNNSMQTSAEQASLDSQEKVSKNERNEVPVTEEDADESTTDLLMVFNEIREDLNCAEQPHEILNALGEIEETQDIQESHETVNDVSPVKEQRRQKKGGMDVAEAPKAINGLVVADVDPRVQATPSHLQQHPHPQQQHQRLHQEQQQEQHQHNQHLEQNAQLEQLHQYPNGQHEQYLQQHQNHQQHQQQQQEQYQHHQHQQQQQLQQPNGEQHQLPQLQHPQALPIQNGYNINAQQNQAYQQHMQINSFFQVNPHNQPYNRIAPPYAERYMLPHENYSTMQAIYQSSLAAIEIMRQRYTQAQREFYVNPQQFPAAPQQQYQQMNEQPPFTQHVQFFNEDSQHYCQRQVGQPTTNQSSHESANLFDQTAVRQNTASEQNLEANAQPAHPLVPNPPVADQHSVHQPSNNTGKHCFPDVRQCQQRTTGSNPEQHSIQERPKQFFRGSGLQCSSAGLFPQYEQPEYSIESQNSSSTSEPSESLNTVHQPGQQQLHPLQQQQHPYEYSEQRSSATRCSEHSIQSSGSSSHSTTTQHRKWSEQQFGEQPMFSGPIPTIGSLPRLVLSQKQSTTDSSKEVSIEDQLQIEFDGINSNSENNFQITTENVRDESSRLNKDMPIEPVDMPDFSLQEIDTLFQAANIETFEKLGMELKSQKGSMLQLLSPIFESLAAHIRASQASTLSIEETRPIQLSNPLVSFGPDFPQHDASLQIPQSRQIEVEHEGGLIIGVRIEEMADPQFQQRYLHHSKLQFDMSDQRKDNRQRDRMNTQNRHQSTHSTWHSSYPRMIHNQFGAQQPSDHSHFNNSNQNNFFQQRSTDNSSEQNSADHQSSGQQSSSQQSSSNQSSAPESSYSNRIAVEDSTHQSFAHESSVRGFSHPSSSSQPPILHQFAQESNTRQSNASRQQSISETSPGHESTDDESSRQQSNRSSANENMQLELSRNNERASPTAGTPEQLSSNSRTTPTHNRHEHRNLNLSEEHVMQRRTQEENASPERERTAPTTPVHTQMSNTFRHRHSFHSPTMRPRLFEEYGSSIPPTAIRVPARRGSNRLPDSPPRDRTRSQRARNVNATSSHTQNTPSVSSPSEIPTNSSTSPAALASGASSSNTASASIVPSLSVEEPISVTIDTTSAALPVTSRQDSPRSSTEPRSRNSSNSSSRNNRRSESPIRYEQIPDPPRRRIENIPWMGAPAFFENLRLEAERMADAYQHNEQPQSATVPIVFASPVRRRTVPITSHHSANRNRRPNDDDENDSSSEESDSANQPSTSRAANRRSNRSSRHQSHRRGMRASSSSEELMTAEEAISVFTAKKKKPIPRLKGSFGTVPKKTSSNPDAARPAGYDHVLKLGLKDFTTPLTARPSIRSDHLLYNQRTSTLRRIVNVHPKIALTTEVCTRRLTDALQNRGIGPPALVPYFLGLIDINNPNYNNGQTNDVEQDERRGTRPRAVTPPAQNQPTHSSTSSNSKDGNENEANEDDGQEEIEKIRVPYLSTMFPPDDYFVVLVGTSGYAFTIQHTIYDVNSVDHERSTSYNLVKSKKNIIVELPYIHHIDIGGQETTARPPWQSAVMITKRLILAQDEEGRSQFDRDAHYFIVEEEAFSYFNAFVHPDMKNCLGRLCVVSGISRKGCELFEVNVKEARNMPPIFISIDRIFYFNRFLRMIDPAAVFPTNPEEEDDDYEISDPELIEKFDESIRCSMIRLRTGFNPRTRKMVASWGDHLSDYDSSDDGLDAQTEFIEIPRENNQIHTSDCYTSEESADSYDEEIVVAGQDQPVPPTKKPRRGNRLQPSEPDMDVIHRDGQTIIRRRRRYLRRKRKVFLKGEFPPPPDSILIDYRQPNMDLPPCMRGFSNSPRNQRDKKSMIECIRKHNAGTIKNYLIQMTEERRILDAKRFKRWKLRQVVRSLRRAHYLKMYGRQTIEEDDEDKDYRNYKREMRRKLKENPTLDPLDLEGAMIPLDKATIEKAASRLKVTPRVYEMAYRYQSKFRHCFFRDIPNFTDLFRILYPLSALQAVELGLKMQIERKRYWEDLNDPSSSKNSKPFPPVSPFGQGVILKFLDQVKETIGALKRNHRNQHGTISKIGKEIQRHAKFTENKIFSNEPDFVNQPSEETILNLTKSIASYCWSSGYYQTAKKVAEKLPKDDEISKMIDPSRLNPLALQAHKHIFEKKLFEVLSFLEKYYPNEAHIIWDIKKQIAVEFLRKGEKVEAQKFIDHIRNTGNPEEVGQLICASLFSKQKDYAALFDEGQLQLIQERFWKLIVNERNPLEMIIHAGITAAPKLVRLQNIMKQAKPDYVFDHEEMPIELKVPAYYHQHLICPVTKSRTHKGNPPVALKCGHVISKYAMHELAKASRLPLYISHNVYNSRARFKCPYCPRQMGPHETKDIILTKKGLNINYVPPPPRQLAISDDSSPSSSQNSP